MLFYCKVKTAHRYRENPQKIRGSTVSKNYILTRRTFQQNQAVGGQQPGLNGWEMRVKGRKERKAERDHEQTQSMEGSRQRLQYLHISTSRRVGRTAQCLMGSVPAAWSSIPKGSFRITWSSPNYKLYKINESILWSWESICLLNANRRKWHHKKVDVNPTQTQP